MTDDRVRPTVHHAGTAELDAVTLYRILRLRAEVFVVEQDCVYLDPDGRDLEPDARQFWADDDAGLVLATLRVLRESDCWRIGRVVTDPTARSSGLGADLMRCALDYARDRMPEAGAPREVVLNAQEYLEGWYRRFGFVRCGATYDEDGIPHVPMRLAL